MLIRGTDGDSVTAANPWAGARSEEWFQSNIQEIPIRLFTTSLNYFEGALSRRQGQGKYWWELRPCTYYSEFALPQDHLSTGLCPVKESDVSLMTAIGSTTLHNDACYFTPDTANSKSVASNRELYSRSEWLLYASLHGTFSAWLDLCRSTLQYPRAGCRFRRSRRK